MSKLPRLMTLDEAAAESGLAPWRLYELVKKDSRFPFKRIGRRIYIVRSAFDSWLTENVPADQDPPGDIAMGAAIGTVAR